jgi:putative transposase
MVIITDNGRALAPSKSDWEHSFGAFLRQHGVEHRRSAPFPQTNGYIESFNNTFRDELLNREIFATVLDARVLSEQFRRLYNEYHPPTAV